MNETTFRRSLRGTAELPFVEEVLDALTALYEQAGNVSEEDRTFFSLAVSEVATNIVTHACASPTGQLSGVSVSVDLTVKAKNLTARFVDDAAPADIIVAEAALPDELAESGRGLAIATMALDQLTYDVHDGNTWKLLRRRRS
ncbi:ATP-binding protein [Nesterenkonia sp. Act20]|uniref:ATP-binding protein n=1 Tax=Nesterenkonia sp. Act20 TaxID=1483432 RepID=UPI001C470366|nr:ATP-binding protein [Nesterenkonia sp. Act20]